MVKFYLCACGIELLFVRVGAIGFGEEDVAAIAVGERLAVRRPGGGVAVGVA